MDPLWEQWVDTFIGTTSRHLSIDLDSGVPKAELADLGERAGRIALVDAGVKAGDIDLVVMGTSTPDRLMPTTANVVADRLGIDQVASYQLQSGCSGAVQALDVARRLLDGDRFRTALVLGGDVVARFYDTSQDLRKLPPAQLVNFVLFGDGAGAAVLSTDPVPGSAILRTTATRLVGLGSAPGATLEWFGPNDRHSNRPPATEDYKAIEERVPTMAREVLGEILSSLSWNGEDIDYLLPPQLSGRMTEKVMALLGLPSATEVSCVAETGNNGNALVFFQLERAFDKMVRGERAVGVAIESSKWIRSGFALEGI
ncbi:3-oxoacyl-ACP synthase III family protein [Saccharothrix sp. SC076]|nr:3-oxoacyl-ACP synthase III family protein [Saccharothrix obliqua]